MPGLNPNAGNIVGIGRAQNQNTINANNINEQNKWQQANYNPNFTPTFNPTFTPNPSPNQNINAKQVNIPGNLNQYPPQNPQPNNIPLHYLRPPSQNNQNNINIAQENKQFTSATPTTSNYIPAQNNYANMNRLPENKVYPNGNISQPIATYQQNYQPAQTVLTANQPQFLLSA